MSIIFFIFAKREMHLFICAASTISREPRIGKIYADHLYRPLGAGGSRILSTAGRKIRYRFPSSKLSTRHVWEVTRGTRHTVYENAVLRWKLRGLALRVREIRYIHERIIYV